MKAEISKFPNDSRRKAETTAARNLTQGDRPSISKVEKIALKDYREFRDVIEHSNSDDFDELITSLDFEFSILEKRTEEAEKKLEDWKKS